jgi:hypothetical protein
LNEDPIEFAGGTDFYAYALDRPTILVDPSGLDGHTWGPITWYTNQQGMSPTQIKAERAHEAQHRCDFWNGYVFTKPCEFLESRGFAAEIPIIEQRLDDLRKQKTLSPAETHEMQQLIDELSLAQGMANPKGAMIHYYCNPPSAPTSPDPYNGFPPTWD